MPRSTNPNSMDIYYADDVTQIVTSNGTLEEHDALVVEEALRLNMYEKRWKIKTNIDKFTVVALGRNKLQDIHIQGQPIAHRKQCRL